MRILMVGPQGVLGRALLSALESDHEIRTLASRLPRGEFGSADPGDDPRDRNIAAAATRGCDAIIDLRALAAGDGVNDLDRLDAATRGTYNLLTTAPAATRYILISSLRLFEHYPIDCRVTEQWAPRPTTAIDDLACHLSELTVREVARVTPIKAICLRFGTVVDDGIVRSQAADPRWLHVEDAVQAIQRALILEQPPLMHIHPTFPVPQVGWWVFHIPGGGPYTRFPLALAGQPPFDYRPRHDLAPDPHIAIAHPEPPDARSLDAPTAVEPRRVVVFGAGGPVAAATTEELADDHLLRLTDVRPLAEIIADGKRQKPGSPAPRLLAAPHEARVVDVTDPGQVRDAVAGMDAIVNSTVVRHDPVEAFRVNTLGAYNIVRAAVATGARRIVQTGPQHVTLTGPAGYWDDFDLSEDLPGRPGALLYTLTKYLGHEICRILRRGAWSPDPPALLLGVRGSSSAARGAIRGVPVHRLLARCRRRGAAGAARAPVPAPVRTVPHHGRSAAREVRQRQGQSPARLAAARPPRSALAAPRLAIVAARRRSTGQHKMPAGSPSQQAPLTQVARSAWCTGPGYELRSARVSRPSRSARTSLGRPRTRSPMMFFWICDEPA